MHAFIDIRCAGHDLDRVPVRSAINLADHQMGSFHLLTGKNLTDDHAADFRSQVGQFLHFKSAAEQLFFQLLRRQIDIHIFLQPAEWYFHLNTPQLSHHRLLHR